MAEKGVPLPKFGEWDVNNPASAEKYTFIFNKARIEKKGGATVNPKFPNRDNRRYKNTVVLGKPQPKRWLCCVKVDNAD